jgi:dihydroflavonol-4-reductase
LKNILVTGASGFVGSNLAAELCRLGFSVRVLVRPDSTAALLRGLDVEQRTGDILDKNSIYSAARGCDTVFHTAGVVAFWKGKKAEQYAVHVTGTRNVAEVCRDLGVEKLVHTSTVAAIGFRNDRVLIDEKTEYNWGTKNSYRHTKHLAELEVIKASRSGLNATIVNPAVIMGQGDANLHSGRLILEVKRGRLPAYVEGGVNIVGVNDVVYGHIAAAKNGRSGERYILGGENLTHKELLTIIAGVTGRRPPLIKIPRIILKSVASLLDLAGMITRREPPLTRDLASSMLYFHWYSIEKAREELGYNPGSAEKAIRDAYKWYSENGYL